MGDKNDVVSKRHIKPAEEIAISEAKKESKIVIQKAKNSERRTVQEIIDTAERAIFKARDIKEKAILKAKAAEKDTINNYLEAINKARMEAKEAKLMVSDRAEQEAEEVRKAREAEEKARKEAKRLARERAKREAEEAKKAKKEAERLAREKAEKEAIEVKKAGSVLYEGMVKLVITPPVDFDHIKELEEDLRQFEDLRLVLIGGSIKEGAHIIVSTEKPAALIHILKQIPQVQETVSRGNEIQVTLK